MEGVQPRSKEVGSITGVTGRTGGTRVKVVKRVREGSGKYGGKDLGGKTGELSSSDDKWGLGEEFARTASSKVHSPWGAAGTPTVDCERGGKVVHAEGGCEGASSGAKVGLARVGLFESAASVGRVGPAYVATGKGGAAVAGGAARGAASMTLGAGPRSIRVIDVGCEGKAVGRGNGAKGRARLLTSPETPPGHDEGYYAHSYGQLAIHKEMLQDDVRTGTYFKSIMRNKHLFKGKVVLDVGCGTGILSIFAAQAGAAKVIGVDMSSVARHAAEVVRKNGFEEQISIVRGKVEEIELEVEKVDIIVSEWMGYCLLYESMLPSVLYARDKWLTKDGLLLPSSCSLYVAGMTDLAWHDQKFGFWDNVEGFNMQAMKALAITEPSVDWVNPGSMLTEPFLLKNFDLHSCTKDDLAFNVPFSLKVTRGGNLTALVAFFDVEFGDGHKSTTLSTSPWAAPTHWKQTIFHLKNAARVAEGQLVGGSLALSPNKRNERDLDLMLEVRREEEEGEVAEHSLFKLR